MICLFFPCLILSLGFPISSLILEGTSKYMYFLLKVKIGIHFINRSNDVTATKTGKKWEKIVFKQ